jgi:hypothetical protein
MRLLVLASLASCTYPRPEDIGPNVVIVSGDGQEAAVATTLVIPLAVRAEGPGGELLAGRRVEFELVTGTGSVSTPETTTTSTGEAQTLLTLGTKTGPHVVVATIDGATATFELAAIAGPPARIGTAGNDQDEARALVPLDPFVVNVFDEFGNPAPGVDVDFVQLAGAGTLDVTSATSDAEGHTQVIVTPSNLGEVNQVEARAGDLDPFTFSARATGMRDGRFLSQGRLHDVGTIDRDDRPDVVLSILSNVFVLSNTTESGATMASFSTTQVNADGVTSAIAIADLDADGDGDLVVAGATAVCTIINTTQATGPVTFGAPGCFASGGNTNIDQLRAADLDGDALPDLLYLASGRLRARHSGSGTIIELFDQSISAPFFLADLDGDGKRDLVAGHAGRLVVARNTSQAAAISFAGFQDLGTLASGPFAVAEVDGDGKPDIVTRSTSVGGIDVLRNTSAGSVTFAARVGIVTNFNPTSLAFADLNGDGKQDLLTNVGTSTVSTVMNASNGASLAFAPRLDWTMPQSTPIILGADFNGDGKDDAVTSNGSNVLVVLAE